MKKKLVYILLTLAVVFTVAYFFRYKRGLTYTNKVPASAEAVFHVNLRQIEQHVLFDALGNPFSYIDFSSSSDDGDDEKVDFLDVVEIPKSIFLYTNAKNSNGFLISSKIEIKDIADFEKFLAQEKFKKIASLNNVIIYQKDKLFFAHQNESLLFAYNYKKGAEAKIALTEALSNTSFLTDEDVLLKKIKTSKSDAVFASTKNDFLELQLNDGELALNGFLNKQFDLFLPAKTTTYVDTVVAHSVGKVNTLFLQNTLTNKQKEKFRKLTSLSLDSINQKWTGDFSLNIANIESKIDTIVTYEYDDDFNKVEKKSTHKLVNPNLDLQLYGSSLHSYLIQENAIQLVESDSLFTTIPLFKLYAKNASNAVFVSSDKVIKSIKPVNSSTKFSLFLNIEKYLGNQLDFYTIKQNERVNLLKNAFVSLSNDNKLSVKVRLKNISRNFAGQFIKP